LLKSSSINKLKKTKYIIFDRDGTLIKHIPYLFDKNKVELLPNVTELIKIYKSKNYKLFLHTNQSGIGRSYFNINDCISCNNKMIELIGLGKDIFEEICIASDFPPNNITYRKPSIKFGLEILKKYKISNSDLYYIGDAISDIETANNLNCKSFGVRSGEFDLKEKIKERPELKTIVIDSFKDIFDL
tara:strand:+ start:183 stop:743 length:561 start_codon:yes stop_codon:yes gene_type:complete